jgi:hypothetical protein
LAARNAPFVAVVVHELVANGRYEYENDSGARVDFRIKREPPPLALQVISGAERKRERVRQAIRSYGGQVLEESDLEPPYLVLSNSIASGLASMQGHSGWHRTKEVAYRGPVEVWVDRIKRFDAHVVLTQTSESAPIPNSDEVLYGSLSWRGHLAELNRSQLSELAERHQELRFPEGQVGEVLMEDTTDGRIRGIGAVPF